MKKIKVMHVLNTGSFSGAENIVIRILEKGKDYVEGTYVSKEGSIRDILEERSISFYFVQNLNPFILRKAIKKINPDLIHAHDFTAGIVAACCTNHIPIINHIHNNNLWLNKINWKTVLFGLFCIKYAKILTVSESIMNEFIFGKYFLKKTKTIGNPVSVEDIRDRADEKFLEEPYDIAFLGRLTEAKNPFLFLDIIKDVSLIHKKIKVAMIGDGELREEVERRIEKLQLYDNITLFGFQKNPYNILNKCKILCMPSKWEGFGLAAVEALALGKPVIASPVGGLVNIIDENCGKLCNNQKEFVDGIQKLLECQELYHIKSQNAWDKANEFDNTDQYMNILLNIYKNIELEREY